MSVKSQAKKLIKKFTEVEQLKDYNGMDKDLAVQCALICANETIYELDDLPKIPYNERRLKHWKEIKKELEILQKA